MRAAVEGGFSMRESLYFITVIARALGEPDVGKALSDAFWEIREKGDQPRYVDGLKNFELFMDAAFCHHDITTTDHARELIVELAGRTFEGTELEIESLLTTINSHPEWKTEYEAIFRQQAGEDIMLRSFPKIQVLSNKGFVGEMRFEKVPGRQSIDDISPGDYSLRLANTGWVIWEGELTAKELQWAEAYGAKDLDLAAETEVAHRRPTREIVLLDGDVFLRTFAGIESGSIEVELTM